MMSTKLLALATSLFVSLHSFTALAAPSSGPTFPEKIYAVNLGSWLLIEPWMLPQEWINMGGERCDKCSTCIASEFAFAEAYPDTVDSIMENHWKTWFSKDDVNKLVALGINTVRIPLGYWIVEDLVDRSTEFFARGGLAELRRGLNDLKDAGIVVVLDHHALPGVASPNQMFAGRCTDDVQFYTEHNYHRALVWTVVMTALTHIDPAFGSVVSIEAINEPIMDANQTPGYGDFQKNFVKTLRTMEYILGVRTQDSGLTQGAELALDHMNITQAMETVATNPRFAPIWHNNAVDKAISSAIPILLKLGVKYIPERFGRHCHPKTKKHPIVSMFSDKNWQYNDPPNPADAAIGSQMYDNHLYYVFGGVADPVPEAYMTHICNSNRLEDAAAVGNTPLVCGEWALPTQFNATDEFLMQWADAQKLMYSKGAGWVFWNFKIEKSDLAGDTAREWSYYEGVDRGYLTLDPAGYHNPDVCEPWIGKTYTKPVESIITTESATETATGTTLSPGAAVASEGGAAPNSDEVETDTSEVDPTTTTTKEVEPTTTTTEDVPSSTSTTTTTTIAPAISEEIESPTSN